jgi:hypothetical protein
MERFSAIDYHQERDFSKKLNATFEFIRQNFKSLVKSILVIAGPPVLIASMIIGSFMGEFFKLIQATTLNPGDTETIQSYFTSVGFWLQLVLMMIFFGVSSVMTIATINNYIVLYGEKQTNQIEVSEVWERVRSSFMMYFTTMFFFFLMAIAMYILLIIPVVLLAAVSPGLIVIGMMLMFVVFFYLTISVSLTFIVRTYERKGFLDSIGRSFKLVQGKWWSTFGLIVVLYLIMMVISYIPMMPWYIMTVISTLHNTSSDTLQTPTPMGEMTTIIFFVLYYMIQMVLATLPNIGIAFQYFNLVELKEAKGLVNKIDTLGETPASTHESEEQY